MLIGDSAFPPATYPTSYQGRPVVGWCVYIPGGDAYHGWSQAEIESLKAQPWCRYIVPIFVRSHPKDATQGARDAATVATWAHAQGQPAGTLTMMDYETAVDSAYETAFDKALRAETGDLEVLYGSKAAVVKNTPPSGGYDEADWTGQIPANLASTAQQFYSCAAYDLNAFRDDAPLWDLRPATSIPAATPEQEDDMPYYPIQVGPDPNAPDAGPYACGGASWPAGKPHVLQLLADPGVWGDADASGSFRLVFSQLSGPDVATTAVGKPAESIAIEFKDVKGLIPSACRGVTITRPDGAKWPWYGHAE